jgi:Fe(3+) dicitrate transport protein
MNFFRPCHFWQLCISAVLALTTPSALHAQDTITNDILGEVMIYSKRSSIEHLPEIEGTHIYAGKKNQVIRLSTLDANLASNNTRQTFSKVPGITIWENDGSGIQISIGARGLSPNRSFEFNTRQNGYDISADVFGYPEAYYTPPLQALEKIEIVRGAASLQYGPQFGGLVNYVIKQAPQNTPIQFETENTFGSYGMFSSFNALSGNTSKWKYILYNDYRKGNGWRNNNHFEIRNTHASAQYKITQKTEITAEYTNMDYTNQQAGGLTDAQFDENSQQSVRTRNCMSTPWNLAAITLNTQPNANLTFNLKAFGLLGFRNSIGFTATPDVPDTINTSLANYNYRQLDSDLYNNVGSELRGIYHYTLFKEHRSSLAFGARAYRAHTTRSQKGKGTQAADPDYTLLTDKFPTEYEFSTKNFALFAENIFKITNKLSITPGIRWENIQSHASGRATITNGEDINITPKTIQRNILLLGAGAEYKLNNLKIYANYTQAYRPILFGDLIPPTTTDVVDPNLHDANGYNADLGIQGNLAHYIQFDISAFSLTYNNRIGTIRKFIDDNPYNATYQFRTNLGKSRTNGIEAYVELDVIQIITRGNSLLHLNLFASSSFNDAQYLDFLTTTATGTAPNINITQTNLAGNHIEYAPRQIHNAGITFSCPHFSATAQLRSSSSIFSDASNTETANSTGTTGKINGYQVADLTAKYTLHQKYTLKAGINNITDATYATRRAGGYPGPGLIPSDGRTFFIGIGGAF